MEEKINKILETSFSFQDACDIVYNNRCKHEWFEGRCVHCNVTPNWAQAVMEANVKLGIEHNRTIDAERKNKSLIEKLNKI